MFFVIVLFLSCKHSPPITGIWQEIGKAGSLEFKDDNTFNAVDDMGMAVSGTYHLDDSGNMRLEIKHHESPTEIINLRVKIEADKLIFSQDGKEIDAKYIKGK